MSNNSQKNIEENNSSNGEFSNNTFQERSIIKALVYGITSKSIPKDKRKQLTIENNRKFYWTTNIDNEIQENQIGKILERVVTEYFITYSNCTLSEFTQEWLWIDFILKYFDIKIWVDISLNSKVSESKINKLLKTAQKIDENHNIWTQIPSKRPDLCASMILQLPPYLQAAIIDWFNEWRENNFSNDWKNYVQNVNQIDDYFKSIIKIINKIIHENIVKDSLIDTIYEDYIFRAETSYNIDKEIYQINIFNNLWYRSVSFSIILTWKYFQKVSPWVKFTRIYDSKKNEVRDYYRNRDFIRNHSDLSTNIQASSWMYSDWDIDITTRNNIPQDIINKIK